MKVRAKSPGYYQNAYRDRGDVFEVGEEDFSDTWLEKAEEEKAKPEATERRQPENEDEREAIAEQFQAEQITAQANKKKRSS